MGDLLLPVGERRTSSWSAHQKRNPRSTEPGTDWYCPIGTPVLAPADGTIYAYGMSITPATGRWLGINFDNGMSFRAMHFASLRKTSGRVSRGDVIAISGASGYGKEDWSGDPNTGGAHVHGTLWPTRNRRFGYDSNGRPYTVDFMNYVGGAPADSGSTPLIPKEWDEMATEAQVEAAAERAAERAIRRVLGSVLGGSPLKSVRNQDSGVINYVDNFGSEQVLAYSDGSIGVDEYVSAMQTVYGAFEDVDFRKWDIATVVANRRWAAKRAEIANEVVAKLTPLVTGNPVVIDPELIRVAIADGLKGVVIEADADLDDATLTAIANRVADVQHERLAS